MSLFYPPDERSLRGRTSDREDMVKVRFVELAPPRRIFEVVSFVTRSGLIRRDDDDPRRSTTCPLVCNNLPPGLRAADNEAGSRLSLEQLASRFE